MSRKFCAVEKFGFDAKARRSMRVERVSKDLQCDGNVSCHESFFVRFSAMFIRI